MTGKQPFEAVVTQHGATVLRVCRAVLGPADADDAWSETFLSAMKAYPDLPADANVEAWLVTIAHRKAIDVTRAAARRAIPVADTPDKVAADAAAGPVSGLDSDLADAVAGLPAKQKQAVAYHYLAGLPYADVAGIVGASADAVAAPPPTASPPSGAPIRAPLQRKKSPMNADDLARDLARAFPGTPDDLRRLHNRLAAAAERDGILDVAYRTVDSPVGPLLLAATDAGWSGSPMPAKVTTLSCRPWPTGSAPVSSMPPPAWTRPHGNSTSTSQDGGAASTCRWTGGYRPGSGAPC